MESRCALVKLKLGTLDRAREWARVLNERKNEVIVTLRDEAVVVESVFLLSQTDGDYLIYYMKGMTLRLLPRLAKTRITLLMTTTNSLRKRLLVKFGF